MCHFLAPDAAQNFTQVEPALDRRATLTTWKASELKIIDSLSLGFRVNQRNHRHKEVQDIWVGGIIEDLDF